MHNVCHSACPVEPTMRLSSIPALRIEWHVTSERAAAVCAANGQIPLRYPGRRQVRGRDGHGLGPSMGWVGLG